MKIFIDAGHNHSKFNTGASGNGIKEQDITFLVAEKLAKKLQSVNIETMLSRKTINENLGTNNSTSLSTRTTMANNWEANYFISLHCDAASSPNAKGSHICVYSNMSVAADLANAINPRLLELGLSGRSNLIVERPELSVLKKSKMPAILIEMGFITNARDADIQKNNQDGLAEAIFKGICDYLHINLNKPVDNKNNNITIKINGNLVDINMLTADSTVYVPIRKISELLGYNVDWNGETKEVNISNLVLETNSSETKYSVIGNTHVIEIDPKNIFHVETQKPTNQTPYDNFVNSVFFMPQKNGISFPQGMAVNAGEIMSNYATHDKPVATLICYGPNDVQLKYITDISKEKGVWFAVSGYGIYPDITAKEEGFVGKYTDVLKSTNRPIVGYRKKDNKIVIAVKANSDAERAKETAKNLNLDFAISLDAGGSTTLKVNGDYKFKGDGRILYGGLIWS